MGNRGGRTVISHASTADKLLIKPAAGARPAPPHTRGQIIPKARTRRPVNRRVTHGTATTRLTPTERYIGWRRADGTHFDPWLRTHERLGAEIVEVAPQSTTAPGSVAEWEEWRRWVSG